MSVWITYSKQDSLLGYSLDINTDPIIYKSSNKDENIIDRAMCIFVYNGLIEVLIDSNNTKNNNFPIFNPESRLNINTASGINIYRYELSDLMIAIKNRVNTYGGIIRQTIKATRDNLFEEIYAPYKLLGIVCFNIANLVSTTSLTSNANDNFILNYSSIGYKFNYDLNPNTVYFKIIKFATEDSNSNKLIPIYRDNNKILLYITSHTKEEDINTFLSPEELTIEFSNI